MKKLVLILAFTFGLTTAAYAQKFDEDVTFEDLGPVVVSPIDNATGGCWTNMKEAKNYAEGQLDMAGAKVADDIANAAISLDISVLAERVEQGYCYGTAVVRVARFDKSWNYDTIILFSSFTTIVVNPTNLNIAVLDLIKKAVDEWK